jgi:glycine hydroxymethyltransferase
MELLMKDFLVRGSLHEVDPAVHELVELEAERQLRKIILIPSESTSSQAVLDALGSRFQNIYAEGYPDDASRLFDEAAILDYGARLGEYRRFSDPRYYKGVEYADAAEMLARRRCAEAFATASLPAERILVNVQALSGAPANNAVYHALVNPGDTVMGMNLFYGGHLSHGSPVNRSGRYYNIVSYTVDAKTEHIDYEAVAALAALHKPKMIIAGFSSYPWVPDWGRFREIADSVGAFFLADIAHIAGLVAAGVIPSPLGHAHVITFTTHKSLCGPRGACILTTDPALAKRIDRAVFPGEQGGPHVNVFAAMAVMFKNARTPAFRELQAQIVKNAARLAARLEGHGFRIPFGGTDTHLLNVDAKSIVGEDGATLSGDMAARILDLAGIVTNRNTIPGDTSANNPSGIRMGTPWVTQRGFREPEIDRLGDLISDVLHACQPHYYVSTRHGRVLRAKVEFAAFDAARNKVRDLALEAGADFKPAQHGYPHFFYSDAPRSGKEPVTIALSGANAREFLYWATSSDVYALAAGQSQKTVLAMPGATVEASLGRSAGDVFHLTLPAASASLALAWLRDLSDGFVIFDPDIQRRLPGPLLIEEEKQAPQLAAPKGEAVDASRPFFAASLDAPKPGKPLPDFVWKDPADPPLKRTSLFDTHKAMGAKLVPFAGWEMPVWYTSVVEEHLATRHAAGLFDVSHMGVWEAFGPSACAFLDAMCGNEVSSLAIGQSLYTQYLDPDGKVIDDTMIYRRGEEKYLIVVNASNDDKDWAWMNAVQRGEVCIDRARPWAKAPGREGVTLRNLRDAAAGSAMRVDIALQGPKSRDILLALGADAATAARVKRLKRTELCDATIGGFDLIVSRTGYTGEAMAFELFIHPQRASELWAALLKVGASMGLKAIGLGARDSLRTEAGLPLYGHEMAGPFGYTVGDSGFGSYVKTHKPWFIGRAAYLEQEKTRAGEVARFRFAKKGVRMAHQGDPVLDDKGRVVGQVTSCAVDSEGYLLGQAYLERKYAVEGTPVAVFQSASEKAEKPRKDLHLGERVTLPEAAIVLSRFPKKSAG